jgi:hypothetical protein
MRESIGQSVIEYNARVSDATNEVSVIDCKSQGRFCRRVERKATTTSLEIYLDEAKASLKIFRQPSGLSESICGYRPQPDGSAVEFFLAMSDGVIAKTSDEACRMAMEDFLFNPFPPQFSASPQH